MSWIPLKRKYISNLKFSIAVIDYLIKRHPGTGFQSLSFGLAISGFQSLVVFRIPWAVFRIPKPRILDSTSKIFPDSGFHKQQKFPRFWNPESGFSFIRRNNAEIAHLHHPLLHFFHGQKHSLVHIRLHLHSLHIFLNFLNATEMHVLFYHFNETLARKVHGFFYKFRRGLKWQRKQIM